MNPPAPSLVDSFAGSGLVTQGAKHASVPVWSKDHHDPRDILQSAIRHFLCEAGQIKVPFA